MDITLQKESHINISIQPEKAFSQYITLQEKLYFLHKYRIKVTANVTVNLHQYNICGQLLCGNTSV